MVRPSNPKLMSKILEAVTLLRESKGSSVRDILQLVKKGSNGQNRNLTMQVQRALKNGVTAGILKHRNGRYKAVLALAVTQTPRRRRTEDDYKVAEEMPDPDESTAGVDSFGAVQDRRMRRKRRGSRKRKGTHRRRASRKRRKGVRRHANEEFEDMGPSDHKKMSAKSRIREDESVEHRNHKNRNSDRYSDVSGGEHESRHTSRKSKPDHSEASRRSSSRSRPREEMSEKNNRRSSSRHRSQSRNNQPPMEDMDSPNAMDCEDDIADNDTSESKNCGSNCSIN